MDSMGDSVVIDVLRYDEELTTLLDVYVKSFKEYFQKSELQSKVQQFEQAIHQAIKTSKICETYVAKSKNNLIGFSCIIKTKPQNWYLGPFAVLPEYRRQGIGRNLLKHAIDFAHRHRGGIISLVTRWYNEDIIRFYQTLDFHIDSEYVYKGEKITRMIRKLETTK
jgi:ribosomal protein S18 acetylase RimI-like enzyme